MAKKWYSIIPAEWIVNCFGFGKTYWLREAWIAFFCSFIIWLLPHPFIDGSKNPTLDKAIFLMQCSAMLFFIAWLALIIYEKQGSSASEEIVVDKFWGVITTFSISTLAMVYAYGFSKDILDYTCHEFLNCVDQVYYLGYLVGVIIPAAMYFWLLVWRPWPIRWADNHVKGSLHWLADDAIAATYTVLCYYLIVFFFMGAKYETIEQFFIYSIQGTFAPVIDFIGEFI